MISNGSGGFQCSSRANVATGMNKSAISGQILPLKLVQCSTGSSTGAVPVLVRFQCRFRAVVKLSIPVENHRVQLQGAPPGNFIYLWQFRCDSGAVLVQFRCSSGAVSEQLHLRVY